MIFPDPAPDSGLSVPPAASFSAATPDQPWWLRGLIRLIERSTGQPELLRLYEENRRSPYPDQPGFFTAAMRRLAIPVCHDPARLAAIPRSGALVIIANHPCGIVDGMGMGSLIEQVRTDFKILTTSLLLRAPEIRPFVLPVDFANNPAARATNIHTRALAREHLAQGGALVIFPAGEVSTAPDRLGRRPAVDPPWPLFVAQLVHKAQAPVLPIYFAGQNSRLFQIVSHIHPFLRLALLFHEVRNKMGKPLHAAIGAPLPHETLATLPDRSALAQALQRHVYALGQTIAGEPVRLADARLVREETDTGE